MDTFGRLCVYFLAVSLSFTFPGAHCTLQVFPVGSTLVNARAGNNVTLAVSFRGAPDPAVTWSRGDLPVLTWVIGSTDPPDVATNYREVLKIEPDGSVTFVNVSLGYTGNYTVEMTKSGLGKAVSGFTLTVYELIQNVMLSVQPGAVQEGSDRFTLQYSMSQGVVDLETWFFGGREIKTSVHYMVEQRSLVVLNPNRSDTGLYTVLLTNPYSRVEAHMNVTVLYGPDEPTLEALPARPFYESGDSLSLVCQAEGFPQPTVEWAFGDQSLPSSGKGVLNQTNIEISQGGVYTCTLINEETNERRQKNITLIVYEKPWGNLTCSVRSANENADLQYYCQWPGGAPQAQLSYPALSNTGSGLGNFTLNVTASGDFNGRTVTCMAVHPVEQRQCNITASRPRKFLPAVRTTVDPDGKIAVTVHCVSEASPKAVVSWSRGNQAVTNGTTYWISSDTEQLTIRSYNVSNFLQQTYTCTCRNPLGNHKWETQLQGPSILASSLFPNPDGTVITLTWEVPSTSVVTGFDIQMKGPNLLSKTRNDAQTRGASNKYRTIQQKPGFARSADVFVLNPNLTYWFRVVPKARLTEGPPSDVHRIGPGVGLSGPAIAGIAAGIPCSLLALALLGGLIYLCVYLSKKKNHQARYPVSRTVEKTKAAQSDSAPHNLRNGGLKSPPDYNRLQQTPSERSVALPTFVPPPPVRVATTV